MKHTVLTLALVLGLGACATQPEKLKPTKVSPAEYNDLTCVQIQDKMKEVTKETNQLHGELKEMADTDSTQMAVGMLLLWPTLFWLEGGDGPEAARYQLLKGQYDALQTQYERKKCQNYVETK